MVIESGGNMVLVDCGDPELAGELIENMRENGLEPERLTHIIITHHDLDHMGGLSQLHDRFPKANIMASPEQAPYIRGEKRWLRLQAEDKEFLSLSRDKRAVFERTRAAQYLQFLPAKVNTLLYDGQLLPFCGGCEVMYTPWHMPGHLSLYLPEKRTLIPGDALCTFDGKLGLLSHVDLCTELTVSGLRRLARLEVEKICACHGGELALAPGQFREEMIMLTHLAAVKEA